MKKVNCSWCKKDEIESPANWIDPINFREPLCNGCYRQSLKYYQSFVRLDGKYPNIPNTKEVNKIKTEIKKYVENHKKEIIDWNTKGECNKMVNSECDFSSYVLQIIKDLDEEEAEYLKRLHLRNTPLIDRDILKVIVVKEGKKQSVSVGDLVFSIYKPEPWH